MNRNERANLLGELETKQKVARLDLLSFLNQFLYIDV